MQWTIPRHSDFAYLPNVQDEPRPGLARTVLLGARIVTAPVVGSSALLGSLRLNIEFESAVLTHSSFSFDQLRAIWAFLSRHNRWRVSSLRDATAPAKH